MSAPSASRNPAEITLLPGEYFFGSGQTRIHTLLGSCVAVTLWHPARRIGGMCHYLLPGRAKEGSSGRDAKYAEDALDILLEQATRAGTAPKDYEVKLFGGGNMFPDPSRCANDHIGRRNSLAAQALVRRHGLQLKGCDLEGLGHRSVIADLASGEIWVKRTHSGTASAPCPGCLTGTPCGQ